MFRVVGFLFVGLVVRLVIVFFKKLEKDYNCKADFVFLFLVIMFSVFDDFFLIFSSIFFILFIYSSKG